MKLFARYVSALMIFVSIAIIGLMTASKANANTAVNPVTDKAPPATRHVTTAINAITWTVPANDGPMIRAVSRHDTANIATATAIANTRTIQAMRQDGKDDTITDNSATFSPFT